jgi:hypothetical protein
MKGAHLIGKKALFKYPDYGTPDGFPEYTAHSGQVVTIVSVVTKDIEPEDEGRLFKVQAEDGWKGQVWRHELTVKKDLN